MLDLKIKNIDFINDWMVKCNELYNKFTVLYPLMSQTQVSLGFEHSYIKGVEDSS